MKSAERLVMGLGARRSALGFEREHVHRAAHHPSLNQACVARDAFSIFVQ
jgi:hypothetical protein